MLAATLTFPTSTPDLSSYDWIIVGFSAGKDSIGCLLHLLECGVDPAKIELRHQDVDGRESAALMDWPSTPAYGAAVARELGVRYMASWKVGGMRREMLRNQTPTAPTCFETHDGGVMEVGGQSGKLGTRLKFPQVTADLSRRWCSAYLKVDVLDKVIVHSPFYKGKRLLVVTGERAEESANRARYKTFEPGRTHAPRAGRHVDHWRPVHGWTAAEVWAIMRRHGIVPHPGYFLGFSRLSCLTCIFASANQWATIRALAPDRFEQIAAYERQFGLTIHRKKTVVELADAGTPYPASVQNAELFAEAMLPEWRRPVRVAPEDWVLPAGAGGENVGPT